MPGLLDTVVGQQTAVETLRRALAKGRVHHAYLFAGPDGVGKERAAFGLAQALVCERRTAGEASACGACSACRRALVSGDDPLPKHPDVVLLERGLYDPAAIGRKTPEAQELSIDQIRTRVLSRSAFGPHGGKAKVFIVRRAEEASIAAANALLKTLEEPGDKTHFVLLSSVPDALLPTIRSRAQMVRFGAVPDAVVTSMLVERGVDAARAAEVTPLAGGSVGVALSLADPEVSEVREALVAQVMEAIESRDAGAALDLAASAKPIDKTRLTSQLEGIAAAMARASRAALGKDDRASVRFAARHALALEAVRSLEGNAATQLALEAMLIKMRSL